MADGREKDLDFMLSPWEDSSVLEWEREAEHLDDLPTETELSKQRTFEEFQICASAIAQLKESNTSLRWVPFQNAAASVTKLYKGALREISLHQDLGLHYGQIRRTKELLTWAKKKGRHIRREDLIAFLCGRNPPPTSLRPRAGSIIRSNRPTTWFSSPERHGDGDDLQPFRDALALQALSGAMSNVTMGYHNTSTLSRSSPAYEGLHVVMDELTRRTDRKRGSSSEPRIDSPSRKRHRPT